MNAIVFSEVDDVLSYRCREVDLLCSVLGLLEEDRGGWAEALVAGATGKQGSKEEGKLPVQICKQSGILQWRP